MFNDQWFPRIKTRHSDFAVGWYGFPRMSRQSSSSGVVQFLEDALISPGRDVGVMLHDVNSPTISLPRGLWRCRRSQGSRCRFLLQSLGRFRAVSPYWLRWTLVCIAHMH